jgi:hypothetical protein
MKGMGQRHCIRAGEVHACLYNFADLSGENGLI